MPLTDPEITVLGRSSSQQVCTPRAPLRVHLLGYLPKARGCLGFGRKDLAVLPTHVLDLASLWVKENQVWSARVLRRSPSCPALSGRAICQGTAGGIPALGKVAFTPSLLPALHLSFLICKTRGCGLVFKVVSKLCSLEPRRQCPQGRAVGSKGDTGRPTPPSHSPFISRRGSLQGMGEGNEKGFCYKNMV